jgi:hypothetical protein
MTSLPYPDVGRRSRFHGRFWSQKKSKIASITVEAFWITMEKRIPNLAPRISQEYRKQRSISSSRRRGFNTQRQTETLMENDSHRKPDTRKRWPGTCCKYTHQLQSSTR